MTMTAVTIPDLDLERIGAAVDRLDLPSVDLPRIDVDLESAKRDLARLAATVQDDLARVDLPGIDLPDLDQLLGRGRKTGIPSGSLLVGGAALIGGLALGGLLAFFFHPAKGAKRRRGARRRLGRIVRRVLG
jgi:hypothetical protein